LHRYCIVVVLEQRLGEETVLERDVSVSAEIGGWTFCDTGHGVGVLIARGRMPDRVGKQRRGVHVIGEHAAFCQRVKIRRFDRTAVTSTSQLSRPVPYCAMNKTLAAPSVSRSGRSQARLETSNVRPAAPGYGVPRVHSLSAMFLLF
jgi:hypothetical protein